MCAEINNMIPDVNKNALDRSKSKEMEADYFTLKCDWFSQIVTISSTLHNEISFLSNNYCQLLTI